MTVLDILYYPHPILRQPCRELSPWEVVSPGIQRCIEDLIETMYCHHGTVGLAAPQVGQPIQLLVMDSMAKSTKDRLRVMINPVIIRQSQWKYSREGCLSFPDYLVTTKRARRLAVNWITPEGELETGEFRDLEAIILQHEIDHLHGILFLDRVKSLQTDFMHRGGETGKSLEDLEKTIDPSLNQMV